MKELIWNGPVLPEEYKSKGYFRLAGQRLSIEAEEMLWAWAGLADKYAEDKVYQKNFYNDLKYELTEFQFKLKFPEDFKTTIQGMKEGRLDEKEYKDSYKKEHKEEIKAESENRKKTYGTCIIDGKETSIMYMVEAPGIFIGRGDNPVRGHWKYRVESKDIEINAKPGKGPKGIWKSVEWNPDVAFGGTYKIQVGHNKQYETCKAFLFSASNSKVNIERNIEKFEHAKKVIKNWDKLETRILDAIYSKDEVEQQTGLVLFLVQNLGIRIGHDKDLDVKADTVGASTLKVKNIKIDGNKVILDFLGKDSVHDHRELTIDNKFIIEAFQKQLNKNPEDKVFNLTDSAKTQALLREVVPEMKNKDFRSAYGCGLLAHQIQSNEWDNLTDKQFKLQYDKCNLEVAKQLNHRRDIDKTKKSTADKATKERIKTAKENLEALKEKYGLRIEVLQNHLSDCKDKNKKKILKDKIKSYKEKILSATEKFLDLKNSLNFKIGIGDIALGTSKTNYSTPELAYSLCKYTGKDPSLIYTKALLQKFEWAKEVDKDLWKTYPSIK